MFAKESEMASSVGRWIRAGGMTAKSEFFTPWGHCDLVGLTFNQRRVARRLKLKQLRSVTSVTRAVLLLQIPDTETRHFITLEKLIRSFTPLITEEVVRDETSRLIAHGFVVCSGGRLQKLNGWLPLQDRIVAVELKLSRVDEALRQAANNLGFANESYVALPAEVARRVIANPSRWRSLLGRGIGLLAVTPQRCEILRAAKRTGDWIDKAVQLYCVEKFWSARFKGN